MSENATGATRSTSTWGKTTSRVLLPSGVTLNRGTRLVNIEPHPDSEVDHVYRADVVMTSGPMILGATLFGDEFEFDERVAVDVGPDPGECNFGLEFPDGTFVHARTAECAEFFASLYGEGVTRWVRCGFEDNTPPRPGWREVTYYV